MDLHVLALCGSFNFYYESMCILYVPLNDLFVVFHYCYTSDVVFLSYMELLAFARFLLMLSSNPLTM